MYTPQKNSRVFNRLWLNPYKQLKNHTNVPAHIYYLPTSWQTTGQTAQTGKSLRRCIYVFIIISVGLFKKAILGSNNRTMGNCLPSPCVNFACHLVEPRPWCGVSSFTEQTSVASVRRWFSQVVVTNNEVVFISICNLRHHNSKRGRCFESCD